MVCGNPQPGSGPLSWREESRLFIAHASPFSSCLSWGGFGAERHQVGRWGSAGVGDGTWNKLGAIL